MIKYTASKAICARWAKIKSGPYVPNKEWNFIREQVGGDYQLYQAFYRCFDGFVLFSPVKLREVPMGGYLFPVNLFDVEVLPGEK